MRRRRVLVEAFLECRHLMAGWELAGSAKQKALRINKEAFTDRRIENR